MAVNLMVSWSGASVAEMRKEEKPWLSPIIEQGSGISCCFNRRKIAFSIFCPSCYDSSIEIEVTDMFRNTVLGICTVAFSLTDYILEEEQALTGLNPRGAFAPT